MRPLLLAVVSALAALTLAGPAGAGSVRFGVSDSHPLGLPNGGAEFYDMMNDVGLTENRITVLWDENNPARIRYETELGLAMEQARQHGIRVILSVYPERARALTASPGAIDAFVSWAGLVAKRFHPPEMIVGNEFNQPRFFQPQFKPDCSRASGAAYMQVLAKSYDLIKSIDPGILVVTSVSPRGNDDCHAKSNISTSPYRFIHDMGLAYRAMHRMRPAWDVWGFHGYPNQPTDPLDKGYPWPNMSIANTDRLKQALYDAFGESPQPVLGSRFYAGRSLEQLLVPQIKVAEIGWQVAIPSGSQAAYFGKENVNVTSEERQAEIYSQLVHKTACDPDLQSLYFYGFIDEANLDRFQAGLIRADGTKRPSYAAVKQAIAATRGCQAGPSTWRPVTSVVGAGVDFGNLTRRRRVRETYWGFTATAKEDATYSAGIFSGACAGASLGVDVASRSLAGAGVKKPVLAKTGRIKAGWSPIVRFPSKRLKPGCYVFAIRIAAAMNPDRVKTFVSRPFRVGGVPQRKPRKK